MATSASPLASFGRLLWKEAAQVLSLLLALCGLSILLHLLTGLIPDGYKTFPALAVLIPNLFALGVPAMLIGQEEEAGTLRWMRTLPIDWRYAVTAKLLVGIVGLVLLWFFAAALLAAAWSIAGVALPNSWQPRQFENEIYYALAFSLQLLCCGFAVSWWLRSPVPSLLTLVPVIFAITLGTNAIIGYLIRERWDDLGRDPRSPEMLYAAISLLLVAAALVATAYWLAHRALVRPSGAPWLGRPRAMASAPAAYAYQPPPTVPMQRPGARLALLWQHAQQNALITVPAFAVGMAAVIVAAVDATDGQGGWGSLSVVIAILCAAVLGSAVFVTDNIASRHRFLAERGLGVWRVWWTRQLVPAMLAMLISAGLVVAIGADANASPAGTAQWVVGMVVVCAFFAGQLASQAIARPAVAIMAGPLVLLVAFATASATFAFYPQFLWTALLAMPFLWLVTLRLCRRWLDGRTDVGYLARVGGWIGLAALAMIVPILLIRWSTVPAAMPEWRAATLAEAAAALPTGGQRPNVYPVSLDTPQLFHHSGTLPTPPLSDTQLTNLRRLTDAVLSNDRAYASVDQWRSGGDTLARAAARLRFEIDRGLNDEDSNQRLTDLYERLLRTMLVSAQRIHQLRSLFYAQQADQFELAAAGELGRAETRELLGAEVWSELVGLLPSAEQRRTDRRLALLSAWRAYRQAGQHEGSFDFYSFSQPRQAIWFEKLRTGRLIDRATRTSLEQLQSGLPASNSSQYQVRMEQWRQALLDAGWSDEAHLPTQQWSPESDHAITTLKTGSDPVSTN